jgi:hypothetical protein
MHRVTVNMHLVMAILLPISVLSNPMSSTPYHQQRNTYKPYRQSDDATSI